MPASVLVADYLLPKAAVNLGRFVTSIDEPLKGFHDSSVDPAPYTAERTQSHYKVTSSSPTRQSFALELTRFLSASLSKRKETSVQVTSDQVKTYYLQNAGEWLQHALEPEKTRKWIERTIDEGEEIYLITGFHTLVDARILELSQAQNGKEGKLVLPISTTMIASGLVVPGGQAIDPSIAISNLNIKDEQREFLAEGEQICAVQYCKLRQHWFSKKDIDKLKLARQAKWERYDRPRLLEGETLDMVGVYLDDVAVSDPEQEICTAEEGKILLESLRHNDE